MNTLSVTLRYRPVRLGWCVAPDDFDAFRRAVRLNFTMWAGRYNPIIPVGDPKLASEMVRLFRVDALIAATSSTEVKAFVDSHKHLPWPFFDAELFTVRMDGTRKPILADVIHPISKIYHEYYKNNPSAEAGIDLYEWEENDPLADLFLCGYGSFPPQEEIGIDYLGIARMNLLGARNIIQNGSEIQVPHIARETIASLNHRYTQTHYTVRNH
jgi:hypothetical protein